MRDFLWRLLNDFIIWVKDNKEDLFDMIGFVIILITLPFLYALGVVFLEWVELM